MWQKRAGHEHDHIDARTGTHHIHLHNPHTGGEHLLHIFLGCPSCPTCGHVVPKDDLDATHPEAHVAEALALLKRNHDAVVEYAAKHKVAMKVGADTVLMPGAQVLSRGEDHKMLSAPRKALEK